MASAASPLNIALMLRVIGNSGAGRLLPLVRPYLTHEDTPLRRFAVQGLRCFRTSEVEYIQIEILLNDNDEDVRAQVAEAYQLRPITEDIVEKLIKAATSDSSDRVRLSLASNLWRARHRFPSIDTAVRKLAKNEPEPKARNDLTELVGHPL